MIWIIIATIIFIIGVIAAIFDKSYGSDDGWQIIFASIIGTIIAFGGNFIFDNRTEVVTTTTETLREIDGSKLIVSDDAYYYLDDSPQNIPADLGKVIESDRNEVVVTKYDANQWLCVNQTPTTYEFFVQPAEISYIG